MKTEYAAGGTIRKGPIPNPVQGIFVNPTKKKRRRKRKFNASQMRKIRASLSEERKKMAKKRRKKRRRRRKNITSTQAKRLAKRRKRGPKGRFLNPRKRRKKARRRRRKNPGRKMMRRRRRNPPTNGTGFSPNFQLGDMLKSWKPITAAALGYAVPGLLDNFTKGKITDKISTYFKERGNQKAQAMLSVGTFALAYWGTTKQATLRKYRVPLLTGLGIRMFRDLLDAFLGTKKDSLSGMIRSIFGITGGVTASLPVTSLKVEWVGAGNEFVDAMGNKVVAVVKDGLLYNAAKPTQKLVDGSNNHLKASDHGLGSAYFYDEPELGSAYFYDEPELSGMERSFGPMGELPERSYGDMGAFSANTMDNAFGDAGF